MYFKLWSFIHFVYILSPFLITYILYLIFRNKSDKVKNQVGILLGVICVVIFIARAISFATQYGFHIDMVPLQICHMANFVILFAFLTKNKTALTLVWCFYFIFGFLSIVFADSLTNYTSRNIRFYAYIFGHLFIAVSGLWILFTKMIDIKKEQIKNAILFLVCNFCLAIIFNNIFNHYMDVNGFANYYYMLKPDGTPLAIVYFSNLDYKIGNFIINPLYVGSAFLIGLILFFMMIYINKFYSSKFK